ncbi:dTDP-4-amino-4,6-dideoxyglucose formyltransferase [Flavobacterium sp. 3-218]
MKKKILVISDNLLLCNEFEKIIETIEQPDISWDFAISPFSDYKLFSDSLVRSVCVRNLRDNKEITEICDTYDIVFSVHCKQIFPEELVSRVKCINIHPGYNPINRGWYPQVFAIINDYPIGATIHEIDIELDHGPIIDRAFVEKDAWDTSLSLYNKVVNLEIELVKKNIVSIVLDSYTTTEPETEGKIYLKKDFNELCEIKLDESQTVGQTINKLRALSHGDYKNAFFIDPTTGKKVFVNIELTLEKI